MTRNLSAASAWTDIKLAEKRAGRGGRFDGREALALALQRGGFRRDSRAREAYSLPGQEGQVRVDFGGDRSKSATLQSRRGAGSTYANVTDTIYFGYVKNEADAEGWARHLHALATGGPRVPHPPIPQKKAPKPETVARRESVRETKHGRGFYVVNATTAGLRVRPSSSVSRLEPGGLYSPLAANHGPFATLDEAVPVAWRQFQDYLQQRFMYLLPVQVIEAASRQAAERGEGYVWWTDGKARSAPVPKEQASLGFAGRRPGHVLPADLPGGYWYERNALVDKVKAEDKRLRAVDPSKVPADRRTARQHAAWDRYRRVLDELRAFDDAHHGTPIL